MARGRRDRDRGHVLPDWKLHSADTEYGTRMDAQAQEFLSRETPSGTPDYTPDRAVPLLGYWARQPRKTTLSGDGRPLVT